MSDQREALRRLRQLDFTNADDVDLAVFRGIAFGLPFAILLWIVIVAALWWLG